MRKKNINFAEQIKNSENFLQKLENIKKTSKDIKEKSKLTVHRNIWVKEYKYLSRLQRDSQSQLSQFLQKFDHFFQYEYQEREIFKEDQFKNFSEMKCQLEDTSQIFSNKLYKQIQNLPLLIEKCDHLKKQEINLEDINQFVKDVQRLLVSTEEELVREHDNINKNWNSEQVLGDELDQGYDDIVYYLKPIADQVKGFDFKKERLKKIKQGEDHLLQYLDSFKDKLTGDEISQVIEEFNQANCLLQEALELEIQKVDLDYEDALSFTHPVITNNTNYQKFMHLYQIYIGRGKNLIQYFERLSIEFPKVSKNNLQEINNYIASKIYKDRKIKAAKRNFLREKQQLFYKVEKEVNLRIQKKIKDAQKQAQKLMRREEKLKLQKQLQILRTDYNLRQQEKKRQLVLIEEQKKVEEKKKDSIRRLYLQDLGKRAEEVKEIKQDKLKKIQTEQKSKKQKQQMERKKKIIECQPKVKERQSIERKKIQKKVEVREYKQKEQQIKQERINKAIQQYPFRPQVEFSEERLNAPTEAMIIRKQVKYDMADKIELSKMTGYNVNQLMGDMRFRLNTALQEAGLAQTDYARQMLNQLSRKPT